MYIVSSDSELINSIAKKYGASTVLRSKENSTNSAHELSACREYFSQKLRKGIELPEYFCVIYPTAILLKAKDFKQSFKIFDSKNIDVVMGVSKFNYHPYKALKIKKMGY